MKYMENVSIGKHVDGDSVFDDGNYCFHNYHFRN